AFAQQVVLHQLAPRAADRGYEPLPLATAPLMVVTEQLRDEVMGESRRVRRRVQPLGDDRQYLAIELGQLRRHRRQLNGRLPKTDLQEQQRLAARKLDAARGTTEPDEAVQLSEDERIRRLPQATTLAAGVDVPTVIVAPDIGVLLAVAAGESARDQV